MAEETLAGLSGRLIDAQEDERNRIAREIHDDYSQRLAVLANDLEELAEKNIQGSHATEGQRLHQLWNDVSEIVADLHSLSHSLHSSTLDNLGLVAGVKALCTEFAGQQQMQIQFAHGNVPRVIPAAVALCLFRISQEGLRNIKRHSGTNGAEVCLEGVDEQLHLSVTDRGKGFDVNDRSPLSGIGIRSMEERLRSLGGHLEIHSRPMEGTRIDAWLPLTAASRRARTQRW
jgi:signal transduction histidine kinase